MRYQRTIGRFTVVAQCGQDLAAQAEELLNQLELMNARGPALHDGTTIQFGWSLLTLRGNDGELYVCEPYFRGDALHEVLPTVDDTLRVLSRQVKLLRTLGITGVDVRFNESLVVAKDCLKEDHIHLVREQPDRAFTGWYIGRFGEKEEEVTPDKVMGMNVYEVFNLRYSVLDVLTLPPGYKVSFTGDIIEAVMDADGKVFRPRIL
ncbi:immunity protein Imm33 domain-containing protein [Puia dinghuensis]|uniref:Imm33-like domain-containing protein n=1 Tax=Puia dinghuensis TaxID=1792502 RepID=A0A8J2XRC6_9BACT|nr:hypothetical protein [Puia dinghuensis]GGA88548.1 hypothetical protein GCM10011511_09730 [Puia dinghuensis]